MSFIRSEPSNDRLRCLQCRSHRNQTAGNSGTASRPFRNARNELRTRCDVSHELQRSLVVNYLRGSCQSAVNQTIKRSQPWRFCFLGELLYRISRCHYYMTRISTNKAWWHPWPSYLNLSHHESFDTLQRLHCKRNHVCLSVLATACIKILGGRAVFACHRERNIPAVQ